MGWLNVNREYLKGLRDGIQIGQNIATRSVDLDEMQEKHLRSKFTEYLIKLGDMIEWLEKL